MLFFPLAFFLYPLPSHLQEIWGVALPQPSCFMQVFLAMTLSLGGIFAFRVSLFPRYYRVVPGRLDILDYTPFRRKPHSIEKINLRGATVDVRYDIGKIEIETDSCPPMKKDISLTDCKERHRFAEAIMLAAMSSAAAPPLPDDELLG